MDIKRTIVRGHSVGALIYATLGFFGGFAGVAIFGPMVPKFTKLMGLTPLEAGLLVAIANLTGSLLRIPFGAWADHSGGKKPFATLLSLALIGMIGLAMVLHSSYPNHMAGKFWLVILIGMFIGSGIATFSVGISQGSYWFPESRQGMASGVFAGVGNLAPGIFSLGLPILVAALGLLDAYYLWTAFLAVVLVIYLVGMHDAPFFQLQAAGMNPQLSDVKVYGEDLIPQGSALESLKEAGKSWATWVFVIFYFISFGGFLGLTSWLPSFWHGAYHTSLIMGGALTAVFSLVTSAIRVPGGVLADKLSVKYALLGNALLIAFGSGIIMFFHSIGWGIVGLVVIGFGMGLQNAVVFKLIPRFVPHAVGGAAGWIGGLGAFGGFVIPPLMGLAASTIHGLWGYSLGFGIFWALVVIEIVVLFAFAKAALPVVVKGQDARH